MASPVVEYFEGTLDPAAAQDDELVASVHRLISRADQVRRLRVRANADTVEDAERARRFGAEGIGLCRTEHMFLGERRQHVERLILAEDDEQRGQALEALLPLQRWDFLQILTAMDGLPTTIRLLEPPLHEFLPNITELSVRVALAEARGEKNENDLRLMQAVHSLHEQNPMLGLRGVRLGLVVPGLFDLQVRAIAEATAQLIKLGRDPQPEIMIPLVGSVQELRDHRDRRQEGAGRSGRADTGVELTTAARHDDRAAAGGDDRGADRRGRGVLLLRHQRSDPDHLGVLPRRRRGRVLLHLPGDGHLRYLPVRDPRRRGRRRTRQDRHRTGPGHPARTSRSGCAASTAATPTRCTSSTTPGSTTSPAHRSASRSPGSKPVGSRSRPQPVQTAADGGDATAGSRRTQRRTTSTSPHSTTERYAQ